MQNLSQYEFGLCCWYRTDVLHLIQNPNYSNCFRNGGREREPESAIIRYGNFLDKDRRESHRQRATFSKSNSLHRVLRKPVLKCLMQGGNERSGPQQPFKRQLRFWRKCGEALT